MNCYNSYREGVVLQGVIPCSFRLRYVFVAHRARRRK